MVKKGAIVLAIAVFGERLALFRRSCAIRTGADA